ncbi:exosome complex component RRP42 isoform X1 [Anthonomus grandis grandis]|uniref:exosome complex component RRP42 isoform X1 n=2 Tax=Anthonomus grandis grandis TaxID=2921223 RepID=UPI002165A9F5|nr:exosome complex component RRP42 isoform X1 [Anthonomus grandis grandis]
MSLSEAEKTFILHGVSENFRVDGRDREGYRPMELETDIVQHAFGSARLRLANTDVLVAVKIEVDTPFPERPFEGKIEFFVDCSANATPDFEGKGGEDLAIELANILASSYDSREALDLRKLCILKGRKCWKLYVDILILECGGNLFDAVSLAVKAALFNTQVPKIKNVNIDGDNVDIEVSDNIHDCESLDVLNAPVLVTLCKIGDHCIVDPSMSEEQCTVGSTVVAVSNDRFTTISSIGIGSLHEDTLLDSLELGRKVASRLNDALIDSLNNMKQQQDVGFLK